MRAVEDEARDRGVTRIWLEVLVQNEPAIKLYEKLGYEHVRDLEVWSLDGGLVLQEAQSPLGAAWRTRSAASEGAAAVAARGRSPSPRSPTRRRLRTRAGR